MSLLKNKIIIIILALLIGILSVYFWYPDNPIEEIAEEIIKEEIGIDIDLTPKSNK